MDSGSWSSIWRALLDYLSALTHYWWIVLAGIIMPALDLYKWHHRDSKELVLPHWLRITIAVAALMLAQFLAYKDSISNLNKVISEKQTLSVDNDKLKRQVSDEREESNRLQQQLKDAKANKVTLRIPADETEWILSKDRERKFLLALGGSRGSFLIICRSGNSQSCRFARQLYALLSQAGWNSKEPDATEGMIMGADLVGVGIRPTNPRFGPQLKSAFREVGLDPVFSRQEGLRDDEVVILIGQRPDYWRY